MLNPRSGRVFGGEASVAGDGSRDGGSTTRRIVGQAGNDRKRKDRALATPKVEWGVPALSSAAEAVRYAVYSCRLQSPNMSETFSARLHITREPEMRRQPVGICRPTAYIRYSLRSN